MADFLSHFWIMSVFHWIEKENSGKLYLANIAKLHNVYKAEKKTDRKNNNFTLTFT